MKIRQGTLSDIRALSELFECYRSDNSPNLLGAKQFLSERIQKCESIIFVAEDLDGDLVGFVQLYPIFSSLKMKRQWLLNDLFVVQSSRGQGISVLLIERAKKLSRDTNACGLILETSKLNTIGNNLYCKVGFELDEEYNHYSWNNEGKLLR
ncbi:GNAT family N-acetyltransferase [bacterium DOLZORAL124_38_8]|nr:MAG: GNAT family N-acetyltransferase [bacterium DOLZORAL124_38_8]